MFSPNHKVQRTTTAGRRILCTNTAAAAAAAAPEEEELKNPREIKKNTSLNWISSGLCESNPVMQFFLFSSLQTRMLLELSAKIVLLPATDEL